MATPTIRATQGGVLAALRRVADLERVTAGSVFGIYNVPANYLKTTGLTLNTVQTRKSIVKTSNVQIQVVAKGLISNPSLKAWGYTLDGHDFYILKLGTGGKTLVYDVSTETWSWWATEGRFSWRASTGFNWRSSGSIPEVYGSNVIVGDDSSGVLWVLAPEKGVDDSLNTEAEIPFTRTATAQMMTRGKVVIPVFSVYLTASLGEPSLTANTLNLSYSDDLGNSFISAAPPMVSENGDYAQEFEWRSLGQVKAPGRLFRITDQGAFARIDGLNINED